MADDFRTFDKAPIVSVVHIRKWSFGIREIILAVIAVLLLVLCIIFVGLFGHAEQKLSKGTPSAAAVVGQSYCVDQSCLQTASRSVSLMNTSVDPCEDFYQYACGNFKNVKTISYGKETRGVLTDIYLENEDKLVDLMEKPVDRLTDWASERKLKEFFHSCNDMYSREKLLGTPFLDKVVTALGGWDLTGTWDEASWDLNTVLKKVQSDFWIDALYRPAVQIDWYDSKRYALELQPAGTGKYMYWYWYLSPDTQKYRDDYQKFIRRVGSLLMRDAKLTTDPATQAAKLDQFVNDTFTVETKIAHLAQNSRYRNDPYQEINKVSLADLTSQTNNVINWVDQFSYMFKDARVTGSTKAVLMRREYFKNMTSMITSLPDADRKRMLHHYFIWRVAELYVQDLSWEYIHANREIYVDTHGSARFSGVYRYCFGQAGNYMKEALGSLFIADHFGDKNRQQVHDITDNLKTVLQEQLDKTPWMDAATRTYAKHKLDLVNFKMGYPEWMANHDAVDSLYLGISINISDFFGNIIRANDLVRSKWSRDLTQGENRQNWPIKVYNTMMAVLFYWNEIIAPAGVLQSPVYDYRQPHYSTFGALGSSLGRYLHHIVDDWGKDFDTEGNYMEGETWWSNKSNTMYDAVHKCVVNVYKNATDYVIYPDGEMRYVYINSHLYAPRAISTINGVRLALKGYRKWVSERGMSEKMLPGIGLTDTQMVFLSYAQNQCYQRSDFASLLNAFRGNLEEDLQVNIALGQLQEFSDAFSCKNTAKMNTPKKCDYY